MHNGLDNGATITARMGITRWSNRLTRPRRLAFRMLACCLGMTLSACVAAMDSDATAPMTPPDSITVEHDAIFANRFRLDRTVQWLTLLISRSDNQEQLVLVQPDGSKLNARMDSPDVHWWRSPTLEIVTINRPMQGPWQVSAPEGTVSTFIGVPDMQLSADSMPQPLYQHEQLKLTARVLVNNQPLLRADILQHLRLHAEFVPVNANYALQAGQDTVRAGRPAVMAGELRDDGQHLDTKAGDGIFTMQLPVNPAPGEYVLTINTGDGIYLPPFREQVTVHPMPLQAQFLQGRTASQNHRLDVSSDATRIVPGSLLVRVDEKIPGGLNAEYQVQAPATGNSVSLEIPQRDFIGNYSLTAWIYAQQVGDRPLSLLLPEQRFMVVTSQQQTQQLLNQLAQQKQQQALSEQAQAELASVTQAARNQGSHRLQMVLLGTVLVVSIFGAAIWGGMALRRAHQRRQALQVLRHQQASSQKVGQRDLSSSR